MDKETDNSKVSSGDDAGGTSTAQNVLNADKDESQIVSEKCEKELEECPIGDTTDAVNEVSTSNPTEQKVEEVTDISTIPSADAKEIKTSEELENTPMKNVGTAEECSSSVAEANTVTEIHSANEKHTMDEVCDETHKLDESLEIVEEPLSAAKEDEAVVIQSVVQLAPPNDNDLSQNTAAVELQSREVCTIEIDKVPDTDVIEVMDITETEQVIDCNEVQVVNERKATEQSTSVQRTAEEIMRRIPKKAPLTSLGLLSQYGSDSDDNADDSSESETASVIAVPTATNKSYRSQVVEIDSDSDTDSSDTVSSASESGEESEYLTKIAKSINKRIEEHDEDDDDEDDDDEEAMGKNIKPRGRRKPPRVRGEMLLDELPPIQDLQISVPSEECIEFGRVHSIVDQLLLVSALPNSILLDLDTVLFLEQGKRVLGEVFDVLGQVADPLYCVRFNTNQQIHEKGIHVGDVVYVAPKTDHTHYVILSSLTKMRGSDASWENDIEPPPRYLEYSDDEEEREARLQLRKQRRLANREKYGYVDDDSDNDEDDQDDNKSVDMNKRSRMQIKTERTSETARPRRERPQSSNTGRRNHVSGNNNYHRRQQRVDAHSPVPHNYQPHTGSWHSHYNQQYHQRPPPQHHAYRSPYSGPYPYQRPMYNTPPPPQRTQHFHPYMHRPPMPIVHERFAAPTGHTMPPPSYSMPPPQTIPSPHNMPPQHISQSPPMLSMPPSSQMTPPPQSPPIHSMSPLAQPFAMPPPQQMSQPPPMQSMPPQQQMLQPPPMHSMPPQQQMSQPPPIHSMPPQQLPQQMVQTNTNYVPNPIAAQLPPQPQPANTNEKSVEPAPPGSD